MSPMLVMFLCMIVGFLANKLKLAPENAATVLSKLENYFLVPALIINTFMKYCTVGTVTEQYKLIILPRGARDRTCPAAFKGLRLRRRL